MHRLGNARDFREVVYDVLVAVDVLLEYLPVVDARLPRRSGVEEDEPLIDLVERNWYRLPANPVRPEMHRAHTAVHRRIIILAAGGYADQLGFDILRKDTNLFDIDRAPHKTRKCCGSGDHQRRRTGDARPCGRFRMCFQQEPSRRFEKADEMSSQRVLIGVCHQQFVEAGKTLVPPGVLRSENDFPSASRSDFATGQNAEGNIHTYRAGMEKVKRPDVECPAGEIGTARRRGHDLVAVHRGHALRNGWHDHFPIADGSLYQGSSGITLSLRALVERRFIWIIHLLRQLSQQGLKGHGFSRAVNGPFRTGL